MNIGARHEVRYMDGGQMWVVVSVGMECVRSVVYVGVLEAVVYVCEVMWESCMLLSSCCRHY